jgi:hypothetical protein
MNSVLYGAYSQRVVRFPVVRFPVVRFIVTPALLGVLEIGYCGYTKGKLSLPICGIMECGLPVIAEAHAGYIGMPDLSSLDAE